jgi:hypothetical protein
MKIQIEFTTDNAAFEDYFSEETARILTELAYRAKNEIYNTSVLDLDGNKIGQMKLIKT